MKYLNDYNFKGKKALVRVDFNVPLNDKFEVTDDNRLTAAVPTIKKILADGGSAILMSHLGRPKGGPEEKFSLKHIIPSLKKLLGVEIGFADDCIGQQAIDKAAALKPGQVLLLENLRFYKEEEKGDEAFAQKLAKLGDVWVNDAFGTAHRAHASTAVMGKFLQDRVCGMVMQAEIDNAEKVLTKGEKPFVAIMGGAKVSDKILIIEQLLDRVTHLLIGGGMAYTFFKAQGGEIGKSLCENERLELAKELLEKAKQKGVTVLLPEDSKSAKEFKNEAESKTFSSNAIEADYMGLDIGPKAIAAYAEAIGQAKTILWNGPMGVFEMENFSAGTKAVAEAIAKATVKGAYSLIGGGDSAAAINQFGYADKVSYVSTGGGALLEYMEGKELPGVAALK